MSNIRVTYAGLIGFAVGLGSIFTGLIFVLVITRTLTPEEFGTWSLIGHMISYFLIADVIISYWSVRQISRKEQVGKSSIITSTLLSGGVVPLYIGLAIIVSSLSNADLNSLIFGVILIPAFFIHDSLSSINLGHKPQAISYGNIVNDVVKIPTVLYLVFFLGMGVEGVVLAILAGYIARILLQGFFARSVLKDKFKLTTLKRWIKLSWIPLYSVFLNLRINLDVILYPLIVGSVIGVAFYQAAFVVAAIISHAGTISSALYPKLLGGGTKKDIENNFVYLMYFGIPLMAIAVIFSKPALFSLNPLYVSVWLAVVFLGFRMFFLVLNRTFYIILVGTETIDVEKNPTFSKLVKSKLFYVPTIRNIQLVLHLSVISIMFFLLSSRGSPEEEIVTWWAAISLLLEIPMFVYLWFLVRRNISFHFPTENTLKYILAAVVFVLVYFVTADIIINYEESIYDHLPSVIAELSICVIIYLTITYLIDKKTRILFKSIIFELTTKNKQN